MGRVCRPWRINLDGTLAEVISAPLEGLHRMLVPFVTLGHGLSPDGSDNPAGRLAGHRRKRACEDDLATVERIVGVRVLIRRRYEVQEVSPLTSEPTTRS